jgi:hypothetical protein
MVAVRYLDLVVLAVAFPIFVVAGLPLLGYAAAAVAWLVQRGVQVLLLRRAQASQDVRGAVGITAASMIGRGYLVALTIFGAGLIERKAGLTAAILVIVLFTVYFATSVVTRQFDSPQRPAP